MKLDEARKIASGPEPTGKTVNGACSECVGRLCRYHQAAGLVRWHDRGRAIRDAYDGLRQQEISRFAALHEIESDEAGTAREKARRIMRGENPIPRHLMISGV